MYIFLNVTCIFCIEDVTCIFCIECTLGEHLLYKQTVRIWDMHCVLCHNRLVNFRAFFFSSATAKKISGPSDKNAIYSRILQD